MNWEVRCGDVLDELRKMPAESVHCCVTSPPYWGLRDYGCAGQVGLEATPAEYVAKMVEVFREVRRVLRSDGTLWLNLGDSYAGSGKGWNLQDDAKQVTSRAWADRESMPAARTRNDAGPGYKPKDLVGIPWSVAFALRDDGWWLRSDIIWAKPNPMPESVTDRPTKAHEYLFLLAKSQTYYYDQDAVREAGVGRLDRGHAVRGRLGEQGWQGVSLAEPVARNRRSVWTIATEPFPEAHFATMPTKLVEPCILAGSPVGGVVLDPFCGSGTVGVVALRHNRSFIGIDIKPEYCEMARRRIENDAPLFNVREATT